MRVCVGFISVRFSGSNVVSYKILTSRQRNPIIRAYLPPSTLDQLPDIWESLYQLPGREFIVIGKLNADIDRLQNLRSQQVENFHGILRLGRPSPSFQAVAAHEDVVAVTAGNICMFVMQLCPWVEPPDFLDSGDKGSVEFFSNHFALRARLLQRPTHFRGGYLRVSHAFPLTLTPMVSLNLVDTKFQDLKALETLPPHHAPTHPDPSGCLSILSG